ncbi:MAG: YfiR family protein, partial [bacterium]|nr:YfiR family protein [bacterium]
MKKIQRTFTAVLLIFVCSIFVFPKTVKEAFEEYQAKAVLLGKFPLLITWPESSGIDNPDKPFVIAVVGKNPFGKILETAFPKGKRKIYNKNVSIKYFASPEDITDCHILFISKMPVKKLKAILSFIKDKPILTVSDTRGVAKKGVHINFYRPRKQLKLEINLVASHSASLKIS